MHEIKVLVLNIKTKKEGKKYKLKKKNNFVSGMNVHFSMHMYLQNVQ